MVRRAALPLVVAAVVAVGPSHAQTVPIRARTAPIVVKTAPMTVPALGFAPLAVESGLMAGTPPAGLLPLPAMPAFMPHPVVTGPPARKASLPPAGSPPDLRREPAVCANVAALGYAVAVPKPPIDGPGECGAAEVVELAGVVLADGRRVAIDPPATLNCAMAEAVARWMREDLAPTATRLGHSFRSVRNFASYDCRGRNRNPLARMSEHGRANALDIRGFESPDGRVLAIDGADMPPALLAEMKRGACQRFTTVLGPGSDGFHETHIHVDLAERRGGMRLCQWDLPGAGAVAGASAPTGPAGGPLTPAGPRADAVPLPRPRPSGL